MLDERKTRGYNIAVMEKFRFMRLWDLYGKLLTPTQQDMTHLYFDLDLTVSEIADGKGVSRQAVSDCLNKCKRELEAFEEKLGHAEMLSFEEKKLSLLKSDIKSWAEAYEKEHPGRSGEISSLFEIIEKDCEEGIEKTLKNEETGR